MAIEYVRLARLFDSDGNTRGATEVRRIVGKADGALGSICPFQREIVNLKGVMKQHA